MNKAFYFFARLLDTLKYNLFYILVSILPTYILYRLDQGRDIINNLFLNENGNSGVNLSLLLFGFSLMAYSLWCIPTPSISLFTFFVNPKNRTNKNAKNLDDDPTRQETKLVKLYLFYRLVGWYNGDNIKTGLEFNEKKDIRSMFPIRYFALMPFVIYVLTIISVVYGKRSATVCVVVSILIGLILNRRKMGNTPAKSEKQETNLEAISIYLVGLFKRAFGDVYTTKKYYSKFLLITFCYFFIIGIPYLILHFFQQKVDDPRTIAWLYILIAILCVIALFHYFRFLENFKPSFLTISSNPKRSTATPLTKVDDEKMELLQESFNFGLARTRYNIILALVAVLIIGIWIQYTGGRLYHFSPALIIVLCITAIILVSDTFFTAQYSIANILLKLKSNRAAGEVIEKKALYEPLAKNLEIDGSGIQIYRLVILVVMCFFGYVYLFNSLNDNKIRREPLTDFNDSLVLRTKLETYFTDWIKARDYDIVAKRKVDSTAINDSVLTVYLISGQGGGSRAGIWFLSSLLKMDSSTQGAFYKQCLSISTVSGSSSGAEMYVGTNYIRSYLEANYILSAKAQTPGDSLKLLAKQEQLFSILKEDRNNKSNKDSDPLAQKINALFSDNSINLKPSFTAFYDSIAIEAGKTIYSKNFVSSSVFGILMGDLVSGVFNKISGTEKDRNYYFQQEELQGFINGYKMPLKKVSAENDSVTRLLNYYLVRLAKSYFLSDYMTLYSGQLKYYYPMLLINATIVDNGTKGIFSPVPLKDYSLHHDLYRSFRSCDINDNYALPMVTAINQSQAFPLINAYNHLHNAGRLGDGGFYENTGTGTTLELYQALRLICRERGYKNIKFVLISVLNSKVDYKEYQAMTPSTPLATINATLNMPFNGHQKYAKYNLERQVNSYFEFYNDQYPRDTSFTIMLNKDYNLNRVMSRKDVSGIISLAKTPNTSNFKLIDSIVKQQIVKKVDSSTSDSHEGLELRFKTFNNERDLKVNEGVMPELQHAEKSKNLNESELELNEKTQ